MDEVEEFEKLTRGLIDWRMRLELGRMTFQKLRNDLHKEAEELGKNIHDELSNRTIAIRRIRVLEVALWRQRSSFSNSLSLMMDGGDRIKNILTDHLHMGYSSFENHCDFYMEAQGILKKIHKLAEKITSEFYHQQTQWDALKEQNGIDTSSKKEEEVDDKIEDGQIGDEQEEGDGDSCDSDEEESDSDEEEDDPLASPEKYFKSEPWRLFLPIRPPPIDDDDENDEHVEKTETNQQRPPHQVHQQQHPISPSRVPSEIDDVTRERTDGRLNHSPAHETEEEGAEQQVAANNHVTIANNGSNDNLVAGKPNDETKEATEPVPLSTDGNTQGEARQPLIDINPSDEQLLEVKVPGESAPPPTDTKAQNIELIQTDQPSSHLHPNHASSLPRRGGKDILKADPTNIAQADSEPPCASGCHRNTLLKRWQIHNLDDFLATSFTDFAFSMDLSRFSKGKLSKWVEKIDAQARALSSLGILESLAGDPEARKRIKLGLTSSADVSIASPAKLVPTFVDHQVLESLPLEEDKDKYIHHSLLSQMKLAGNPTDDSSTKGSTDQMMEYAFREYFAGLLELRRTIIRAAERGLGILTARNVILALVQSQLLDRSVRGAGGPAKDSVYTPPFSSASAETIQKSHKIWGLRKGRPLNSHVRSGSVKLVNARTIEEDDDDGSATPSHNGFDDETTDGEKNDDDYECGGTVVEVDSEVEEDVYAFYPGDEKEAKNDKDDALASVTQALKKIEHKYKTKRWWDIADPKRPLLSGGGMQPHWTPSLRLQHHLSSVRAVDLTTSQSLILSGGDDRVLRAWDTRNWLQQHESGTSGTVGAGGVDASENVLSLRGHTGSILCIAHDPTSCRIMETRSFSDSSGATKQDVGSSDVTDASGGALVFTGSADSTIRLWRLPFFNIFSGITKTEKKFANAGILTGHTAPVWSLQVHSSLSLMLSASVDGTCRLWSTRVPSGIRGGPTNEADVTSELQRAVFQTSASGELVHAPSVAKWIPCDSRVFAVGLRDGAVQLWDAEAGVSFSSSSEQFNCGTSENVRVTSLASHATLPLIVAGYQDGKMRLWDVRDMRRPVSYLGGGLNGRNRIGVSQGNVTSLDMDSEGFYVAAGFTSGCLEYNDIRTGHRLQIIRLSRRVRGEGITNIHHSAGMLAVACADADVVLLDSVHKPPPPRLPPVPLHRRGAGNNDELN